MIDGESIRPELSVSRQNDAGVSFEDYTTIPVSVSGVNVKKSVMSTIPSGAGDPAEVSGFSLMRMDLQ